MNVENKTKMKMESVYNNLKAIDEAEALGAPLIVLVCGAVPGQPLEESRNQIADGIAAMEEPLPEDVDMSDPEQVDIWKTVQVLLNKVIYADGYLQQ